MFSSKIPNESKNQSFINYLNTVQRVWYESCIAH